MLSLPTFVLRGTSPKYTLYILLIIRGLFQSMMLEDKIIMNKILFFQHFFLMDIDTSLSICNFHSLKKMLSVIML